MSTSEHVEPAAEPHDADPTAPVELLPAPAAEVVEVLARIEGKLAESQRLIDRQTEIAAKLHAENQLLRGGELRQAQKALVLSVLRVFDDVSQMAATTEDPAARNDLVIVAEALADALARNGVDTLVVELGEPFDAGKHKIAAVETTSEPEADRTVAAVVRAGFAWSDGEPMRVSDVTVFKYTAPPEAGPEPLADSSAAQ
jgi:molecular chaperone GrpE (heat shock protein)